MKALRGRGSGWFRPEVLVAFALLVCAVGVGVFVQSRLIQVEEGLPLEVLAQQSDGAFLTRELSQLKVAAEAARRSLSAGELSNLRRIVESADRKIAQAITTREFDHPLGISAMVAVIGPALDDTKRWVTDGLYGQPALSAAVMELIDLRISDAYRQIQALNDQANERALELLQEQAGTVDRLRQSLLLILLLIATLAAALVFFVARERKANAQAQEARTQLREGIDSLSGGFALFDRDERLVLCNSGYAQVFPRLGQGLCPGVGFEEMLRQALSRGSLFEAPADPEAWVEARLAHFRGDGGAMETRTCDKRWHRIAERRTGDGGVVVITLDVTELRDDGEQLSEKSRRLDIALANMVQGLAMFDAEDRMAISNQRFAELLELPPELAREGKALEDIVRHSVRQAYVRPAKNVEDVTRRRLESARLCDELWHREILAVGPRADLGGMRGTTGESPDSSRRTSRPVHQPGLSFELERIGEQPAARAQSVDCTKAGRQREQLQQRSSVGFINGLSGAAENLPLSAWITANEQRQPCIVVDLTADGARIHCAEPAEGGADVELCLPDQCRLRAQVVWQIGNRMGLKFDQPAGHDATYND